MAALSLDSVELSQICAQSLIRRSKHLPAKIYLREWKMGNLMRLRSGAISNPFLGASFLDWWTSSLADTRANHSVVPESGQEQTIHDTSGPIYQPELLSCDHVSVSLKTSRDIFRWGCPTLSKTWQDWVTERRGAYLARLKSAHHTSGSGCSSWPTATTRDWKDTGDMSQSMVRKDGKSRLDTLGRVVQANLNTHGSLPESWATPQASDHVEGRRTDLDSNQKCLGRDLKAQGASGKLNPRWVEMLMGLPVGWTMPSCVSPVTIAPTSCVYSETELCQPPQH